MNWLASAVTADTPDLVKIYLTDYEGWEENVGVTRWLKMDVPTTPFFDLSAMLEKQLEIVLANQRMILAMHETLKRLLPKYETEVLAALANPSLPKKPQQDGNQVWEAMAKKTLLKLRHYQE